MRIIVQAPATIAGAMIERLPGSDPERRHGRALDVVEAAAERPGRRDPDVPPGEHVVERVARGRGS